MELRSKIKWAIAIAAFAGAGVILWTVFEWSLVDRVPANFYMELAGIVWMLFFLFAIVSFVALYELPDAGPIALVPLTLQVLAVLVVFYAPLNALWVKGDFLVYRDQRDAVVAKVQGGELVPNVPGRRGVIALDPSWPRLSAGGNEIIVDQRDGGQFIFFFTFRGPRNHYAGFLYVPTGARVEDSGISARQLERITPLTGHWYHVAPVRDDA